jgi:hypothetical protein
MAAVVKHARVKTVPANFVILSGTLTIGAAGAISAQSDNRESGVVIAKNATGDYRATIHGPYKRVRFADASVTAPAAATAQSLTSATDAQIQGITAAQYAGTAPCASFAIATVRPDTGALADPVNGQMINWVLMASEM